MDLFGRGGGRWWLLAGCGAAATGPSNGFRGNLAGLSARIYICLSVCLPGLPGLPAWSAWSAWSGLSACLPGGLGKAALGGPRRSWDRLGSFLVSYSGLVLPFWSSSGRLGPVLGRSWDRWWSFLGLLGVVFGSPGSFCACFHKGSSLLPLSPSISLCLYILLIPIFPSINKRNKETNTDTDQQRNKYLSKGF